MFPVVPNSLNIFNTFLKLLIVPKVPNQVFLKVVLKNVHGTVEFAFKFYVTVEGGMDFRAMLMKRKVKQKKVVVKKIEWLEVNKVETADKYKRK